MNTMRILYVSLHECRSLIVICVERKDCVYSFKIIFSDFYIFYAQPLEQKNNNAVLRSICVYRKIKVCASLFIE